MIAWPPVGLADVGTVQWRVWVGHQLAQWRKKGDHGRPMMQKKAAAHSGLKADVISRIESGHRGCDVVELRALAQTYQKKGAEIGALFTPPTASDWAAICRKRQPVAITETLSAAEAAAIDAKLRIPPTLLELPP